MIENNKLFKNKKVFEVSINDMCCSAMIVIYVNQDTIDNFIKAYSETFSKIDSQEEAVRYLAWAYITERGSGGYCNYFIEGFGYVYNHEWREKKGINYSDVFQIKFFEELDCDADMFDCNEITDED